MGLNETYPCVLPTKKTNPRHWYHKTTKQKIFLCSIMAEKSDNFNHFFTIFYYENVILFCKYFHFLFCFFLAIIRTISKSPPPQTTLPLILYHTKYASYVDGLGAWLNRVGWVVSLTTRLHPSIYSSGPLAWGLICPSGPALCTSYSMRIH